MKPKRRRLMFASKRRRFDALVEPRQGDLLGLT